MTEQTFLNDLFEQNRPHLQAVAYRMLGSLSEADDAVQEAWLKLNRSDTSDVENLGGWLTTVVARVCLDMLRSRKSRREEPLDGPAPDPFADRAGESDPEREALLADSVGLALLVVLETLAPAERLAFVLHDLFAVSFDEIGAIVGRSPVAARQLASRARRRVQGAPTVPSAELSRQRTVVDAFLAALRAGDFEALVAVLDPEVVVRVGGDAGRGPPREIRGARVWAKQALGFATRSQQSRPALVDGTVGVVVAPRGRLFSALKLTIVGDKITQVDVVGGHERLRQLDISVLGD